MRLFTGGLRTHTCRKGLQHIVCLQVGRAACLERLSWCFTRAVDYRNTNERPIQSRHKACTCRRESATPRKPRDMRGAASTSCPSNCRGTSSRIGRTPREAEAEAEAETTTRAGNGGQRNATPGAGGPRAHAEAHFGTSPFVLPYACPNYADFRAVRVPMGSSDLLTARIRDEACRRLSSMAVAREACSRLTAQLTADVAVAVPSVRCPNPRRDARLSSWGRPGQRFRHRGYTWSADPEALHGRRGNQEPGLRTTCWTVHAVRRLPYFGGCASLSKGLVQAFGQALFGWTVNPDGISLTKSLHELVEELNTASYRPPCHAMTCSILSCWQADWPTRRVANSPTRRLADSPTDPLACSQTCELAADQPSR